MKLVALASVARRCLPSQWNFRIADWESAGAGDLLQPARSKARHRQVQSPRSKVQGRRFRAHADPSDSRRTIGDIFAETFAEKRGSGNGQHAMARTRDHGLRALRVGHRWAQMKHRWDSPNLKDMVYWIFQRRGGDSKIGFNRRQRREWRPDDQTGFTGFYRIQGRNSNQVGKTLFNHELTRKEHPYEGLRGAPEAIHPRVSLAMGWDVRPRESLGDPPFPRLVRSLAPPKRTGFNRRERRKQSTLGHPTRSIQSPLPLPGGASI
jgi:hypothetical protein